MIQRIQSVWLFIVALLNGALFIAPVYRYTVPGNMEPQLLAASNYYPLLLLAALITIVPLITIFMFLNRKRQKALVWLTIAGVAGFVAVMLMKIAEIKKTMPTPGNDSYVIPGALLSAVSLIFLLMSLAGIRKDDKLVRSVDRLR